MELEFKKPKKEPLMLTWNERAHIKFLHKSDPVHWNVEQLSNSFPALPHTIYKILRRKWRPENELKLRQKDETVLKNWEKFKRGELEASPELLNHLQKFIDKRTNLKAQLENPKFLHLEGDVEKTPMMEWKNGPLSSIVSKYEKELLKLQQSQSEEQKLLSESVTEQKVKQVVIRSSEILGTKIAEEREKEFRHGEFGESFMVDGKKMVHRKMMTLNELKENMARRDRMLPKFDEAISKNTLETESKTQQIPLGAPVNSNKNNFKSNTTENSLMKENKLRHVGNGNKLSNQARGQDRERQNGLLAKYKSTTDLMGRFKEEDVINKYENLLSEKDISKIPGFGGDHSQDEKLQDEKVEPQVEKKEKKPVQYFGTEKDKEKVKEQMAVLSETCFFKTNYKGKRTKSLDAGIPTVSPDSSPHLAGEQSTYFVYDYPEKITIPEDKRVEGKIYKVNDCYYDEKGRFLYRVPGMFMKQ